MFASEHEDLSAVLKVHIFKKAGTKVVIPELEKGRQVDPWGSVAARRAPWVSVSSVKDPV